MFKSIIKTIAIILVLIAFIIFIAIVFSLFLTPEQKIRYNECVLLQNNQTGEVDCFGCVNDTCKDAPTNWVSYKKPAAGIPYDCFEGPAGCQLAQ